MRIPVKGFSAANGNRSACQTWDNTSTPLRLTAAQAYRRQGNCRVASHTGGGTQMHDDFQWHDAADLPLRERLSFQGDANYNGMQSIRLIERGARSDNDT